MSTDSGERRTSRATVPHRDEALAWLQFKFEQHSDRFLAVMPPDDVEALPIHHFWTSVPRNFKFSGCAISFEVLETYALEKGSTQWQIVFRADLKDLDPDQIEIEDVSITHNVHHRVTIWTYKNELKIAREAQKNGGRPETVKVMKLSYVMPSGSSAVAERTAQAIHSAVKHCGGQTAQELFLSGEDEEEKR
jgi:hypothetical protein